MVKGIMRRITSVKIGFLTHRSKFFSSLGSEGVKGLAHKENEVKTALSAVREKSTNLDIVTAGYIQSINIDDSKNVTVDLDLLIPGHPDEKEIIREATQKISYIPWITKCQVKISRNKWMSSSSSSEKDSSISRIEHIIAVSSCKGGVGKSTIAVNLAFTLAKRGLKVGILDADVYGPSLPHLVSADDQRVLKSPTNPSRVLPVKRGSVKMLSFAHVNPRAGIAGAGGREAAVLRGPQVSKVINQLILGTEWGDLDYLVVDMPPGTGDIQITACQTLQLSGAVVVTTPHRLATEDVRKGIQMFEGLKVPVLAVVENMAYFDCRHGERYFPFGQGGRDRILQAIRPSSRGSPEISTSVLTAVPRPLERANPSADSTIEELPVHSFPLDMHIDGTEATVGTAAEDEVNNHPERVTPHVLLRPSSELSLLFDSLADDTLRQILIRMTDAVQVPIVSYSTAKGIVLRYLDEASAQEMTIPPYELRLRDPLTGLVKDQSSYFSEREKAREVYPLRIDKKGRYAIGIVWSDGYSADIYSYSILKKIAQDICK